MNLSNFFRSLGRKTSDGLVGVASGSKKLGSFDSPKTYNTIVGIGVIAVVASGWLIWRAVFSATALKPVNNTTTNTTTQLTAAEADKLRAQDTDGDGLSDYNELYAYHTSPYLKDSDSDSTNDDKEVQAGSDPNCPQGKACESFRPLTSVTDSSGELTPEFLRQALAQAGISQTALDKTDDATLLSIYNQVTSNTSTNTNTTVTNTSANTNTGVDALSELQNLTAAQIRELLQQNGVDAATLNQLDDATLQTIFKQSVSSASNSSTQ